MRREDLDAAEGVPGIFLVRYRVKLNEEFTDAARFDVDFSAIAIRRLRLRSVGRSNREHENR
jgi:hypothetical protein